MTALIFDDAEHLARHAAGWLTDLAVAAERRFAVCLSGGSTPKRLYQLLAGPGFVERFPWQRVHWFWGDERFVPRDDPKSNYLMVREALLSRAPIPDANIHPIPTDSLAPADAAVVYEQELRAFYGADSLDPARPLFDVTLLGLGEDGHTASLFPGTAVLDERRRWAAAVIGAKPEARITLTYPALASSRDVAFLVAGEGKRAILGRVLRDHEDLPAARIAPVGTVHWLLDRAAVPPGIAAEEVAGPGGRDAQKKAAALRAVQEVRDGMIVGLGSGSTARHVLHALAERVKAGLHIAGIPTSEATGALARDLGIPLTSFAEHGRIDLAIDGADEVERDSLAMIKGGGGALLREKIVASASHRVIIVVDRSKLVEHLGGRFRVPVEIAAFGWQATVQELRDMGAAAALRAGPDGTPFVTDGGNYIADCDFGAIPDPDDLADSLDATPGVLEHGLFLDLADEVIVGGSGWTEILKAE